MKLPLLIERGRHDGIEFSYSRGLAISVHSRPLQLLLEPAIGGLCPQTLVATLVPVMAENTLTGYRPDLTQLE